MAREEKRFQLKPVEDFPAPEVKVIRLESAPSLPRSKPVPVAATPEPAKVSQRLELPARGDYQIRTYQPGIEALIEPEIANPNFPELDWEKNAGNHRQLPWGWFVLIVLILGGAAIWSLSEVKQGESRALENRAAAAEQIGVEATLEREATQLIDQIDAVTRHYFAATTIPELLQVSRHPDRVKSLMLNHYGGKPIASRKVMQTWQLQPLTFDSRAIFWMVSVKMATGQGQQLIIEVLENGEPKIDWETQVCYQPTSWEKFATERPEGQSFDFRLNVTADNFFSHEFLEVGGWSSFQLSVHREGEALFGYAKTDSATAREIHRLLKQNRGRAMSIILRVTVPPGVQSRRGVIIQKLVSPRWIYVDPPEA